MSRLVGSLPESKTGLIDRWVECPDATGGPIHRSRFIKTSLRNRLDGPFVYLDCDSVVTGPLDRLFGCPQDLGFTVDAFFPQNPGRFPKWLGSHYRRLGWARPHRYYSGAVFFAADNARTRQFFERWHVNWRLSVRAGLVADQPPLNAAFTQLGLSPELFSEMYNFLVGCEERRLTSEVCIAMLLASQGPPWLPRYRDLLQRVGRGEPISSADLDNLFPVGTLLPRQPVSWPSELRRRLLRWFRLGWARLGWYDASQS
ncbi:MAG: hypothetical protein ACK6D3_05770 [Planctomycetaceae bacterium]